MATLHSLEKSVKTETSGKYIVKNNWAKKVNNEQ